MRKIESFEIDHEKLKKGLYISRVDSDIITYDLRMKEPNKDNYLTTSQAHTIEHILATYLRNTKEKENIIYVGPMGCRTGFYIILRDKIEKKNAIKIIKEGLDYIVNYNDKIIGATAKECGNYKDHDLGGAKEVAREMLEVLTDWKEENLEYN